MAHQCQNVLGLGKSLISYVIPVKNDPRATACIATLRRYSELKDVDAEIVVCGTLSSNMLIGPARFVKVDPPLKGRCVRAGVVASEGDIVIVCDADLPFSLDDVDTFMLALSRADIALGNRYLPDSTYATTCTRHIASRVFRFLVSLLFGIRGFDTQCGVKAFKRAAVHSVFEHQFIEGLSYDVEVVLKATKRRLRIAQVPVHWTSHDSVVHILRDGPAMLKELLVLWREFHSKAAGVTD